MSAQRTSEDLAAFFEPRSVAVIGASRDPAKVGGSVVANLRAAAFEGRIWPVNPRADVVQGLPAAPSLLAIDGPVDLAVLAVPAPAVLPALKECVTKGIRAAVVISAGFREAGDAGQAREAELRVWLHGQPIRVLGPNCLGWIRPSRRLNATFAPGMPPAGGIAFLSHSGALATAILDWARARRLGFSFFATLGNQADLTESEEAGLPCYPFPEPAVTAIAGMALVAERARAAAPEPAESTPLAAAPVLVDWLRAAGGRRLDLGDLTPLLTAYGISVLTPRHAGSAEEAAAIAGQLDCPVALKIVSPDISHKTDVGGVSLGLTSPAEVGRAAAAMLVRVRQHRPDAAIQCFMVQPMAPPARNCCWAPSTTRSSGPWWWSASAGSTWRCCATRRCAWHPSPPPRHSGCSTS